MNKHMLKFCMLVSIANVSAASYSPPDGFDVGSGAGSQEVSNNEPNSPFGHHVSGGAAGSLTDGNSTSFPFPSAVEVTYDGHESRIEIDPNMTVFTFRNMIIESLKLQGGHRFMLNGREIMAVNVDATTRALTTLRDTFSGRSGIVPITIVVDPTRSPLQSKTSTPVPQAGEMSPATKPVGTDGKEDSDSSLGNDTTPPKATEQDADIPAVTE